MWTYWITTDNVFWTDDTVDKPSRTYLDNMNWEQTAINVDLINPSRVEFYSSRVDITLIKIINNTTNQTLYYRFNRILKYNKNNYLLEFVIDYWCMYSLNLLEQDINVLVDRHQDYDDNRCLEFNDEILDSLDLNFDDISNFDNEISSKIENGKIVYGTDSKLIYKNENDVLNGKFCLVINDNDVNEYSAYTFIPILSYADTVEASSKNKQETNFVKTFDDEKIATNWYNVYLYDFGSNENLIRWYENNFIENNTIDFKFKMLYQSSNSSGNQVYEQILDNNILNKIKINNLVIEAEVPQKPNTSPLKVKYYDTNGYSIRDKWTLAGVTDFNINVFRMVEQPSIVLTSSNQLVGSIKVYNNSLQHINRILKSQQYSSKINGLFVIPNIMLLTNLWSEARILNENVLTLKIQQQGVKLIPIELFKVNKADDLQFNWYFPLFKKIHSYYQINWMNNNLAIDKFIDHNDKVIINGYLNFTNTFNIITDNKYMLLENRVLTLPAQQPLKFDKYNAYVQANMNSVNAGYEIQKQQTLYSGFRGVFGSLLSGVIGSAVGGNAFGAISGIGGTANTITNTVMSLRNYEKQIKAKYADANNQLGNDLLFSSTRDMLFSQFITAKHRHYETVMVKFLSQDSIIQLNNTLLLNGVYNPKYFKLNQLPNTTQHLGFKYAKLNSTNFNQIFSKYINEPLNVKEQILAQLCEFRVWDKVPSVD